ncbi:UNVERIFIED_CONTAM: hypothetical protein GTU68_019904, partial [Idotea baltica]|nr:hypothetical protein [Idotea baltica]
MNLLIRLAALKCASIQTLAKVFSFGIHASKRFSSDAKEPTSIPSCASWLTFFNPRLFPANTRNLSTLPDNVAVYLTLNVAALRPYPDQGLILRGLFMRDFLATKTILDALQDMPGEVRRGKACGGTLCLGHLCTP